jgi:lysyl-tRNA synthetase class 1
MTDNSRDLAETARTASSWPFQEARALLDERLKGAVPAKGYVLFETGYGPSGLPHIGTFGEVVRTTMVRRAFEALAPGLPTRLFAFSDDRDGLRKVPDNVPNQALLQAHLGEPLTSVPDPFGTHPSFGEHNNAMLRGFLDSFGFEYQFQSATDWYVSGRFDKGCLAVLAHYDAVMEVMLPTLGEERQQTYSPFLPISPKTGQVLQVPVVDRNVAAGTIVYRDTDGSLVETPVTGGRVKLQWKADWAMRWYVLGVDYEMSGKDLISSYELASRICRIIGGEPPMNLTYELFLDEQGQKISKSKGNGLSVEEWLRYAPPESLALFMFQKPRAAKRLYFDVIPRAVDEYLTFLEKYPAEDAKRRLDNPVWHIHAGHPPLPVEGVTYSLLLNLASVCHAEDRSVLWHFITRARPGVTAATAPIMDRLVDYAVAYYRDFVRPQKRYRMPTAAEAAALTELASRLSALPADADAEAIQTEVYAVGKSHAQTFPELKAWFAALYNILLGQDQGPRMGSFIALFGREETIALIRRVLAGEDLAA